MNRKYKDSRPTPSRYRPPVYFGWRSKTDDKSVYWLGRGVDIIYRTSQMSRFEAEHHLKYLWSRVANERWDTGPSRLTEIVSEWRKNASPKDRVYVSDAVTVLLHALTECQIDEIPQAAFYLLSNREEWRQAALEYLEPIMGTGEWEEWCDAHPSYVALALRSGKVPDWLRPLGIFDSISPAVLEALGDALDRCLEAMERVERHISRGAN